MLTYIIHINATLNNTIFTITDMKGNTLLWKSSGSMGLKGTNKTDPISTEDNSLNLGLSLIKLNYNPVHIQLKGIGIGRISSIKGLKKSGISILSIQDLTAIPHNGCRPSKKRRL